MVKLYLNENDHKGKVKYVDVNIWSLVKANILAELILAGIIFITAFFIGFFGVMMFGV